MLGSRSGLNTADDTMATIAAKLAELFSPQPTAVWAHLVGARAYLDALKWSSLGNNWGQPKWLKFSATRVSLSL